MRRTMDCLLAFLLVICLVSVQAFADGVTYTTEGGTWVELSDGKYAMDTDGDGAWDVYLTKEGDEWLYDFVVQDDEAEYYVWEHEAPDGYTVVGNGTDRNPVLSGIVDGINTAVITNEKQGHVIEKYSISLEKDYVNEVISILQQAGEPMFGQANQTLGPTQDVLWQSQSLDDDVGAGIAAGASVLSTEKLSSGGQLSLGSMIGMTGSAFKFRITLSSDDSAVRNLIMGERRFGGVLFTDGVAEVVLRSGSGGKVTLTGIPEGTNYKIEELDSDEYIVKYQTGARTESVTDPDTGLIYDETVYDDVREGSVLEETVTGDVAWVCSNEDKPEEPGPTVSLEVTKTCEADADALFDFQAILSNLEPGKSYVGKSSYIPPESTPGQGGGGLLQSLAADDTQDSYTWFTADAAGMAYVRFNLKHGDYMKFEGLPVGTAFQAGELSSEYQPSFEITGVRTVKTDSATGKTGEPCVTENELLIEKDAGKVAFTNVPEPEPELLSISVKKIWPDDGEYDAITVYVKDDGDLVGTMVLDSYNNWQDTFTDLPRVRGDGVTPCEYEVTEEAVPGYASTVNKISESEYEIVNTPYDTANLTISKAIKNRDKFVDSSYDPLLDTQFVFDISLGSDVNGVFNFMGTRSGTIRFVDGTASIKLRHGDEIAIMGLPKGSSYNISERDVEGFMPVEPKSGSLGDSTTVAFENTIDEFKPAPMPETGGSGIVPFMFVGACLVALGIYLGRRRKA